VGRVKEKDPSYEGRLLDPAVVGWCVTRPVACDGNCPHASCSSKK